MQILNESGSFWLSEVTRVYSPNYDRRPDNMDIELLVIHSISLPPGKYGGPYIEQLFTNILNPQEHHYFQKIYQLRVSAHLLIRRDGQIIQFVPFNARAWHAGISEFYGKKQCNDFSIGIELEGCDNDSFTDEQYQNLAKVSQLLCFYWPSINKKSIVGHSDIAPERKTDPGPYFDWHYYRTLFDLNDNGNIK